MPDATVRATGEVSVGALPAQPYVAGQATLGAHLDFITAHSFLVRKILSTVATATLVQVVSCTNDGGLSPVGRVDVMPLVNQVDGQGNGTPHGTIHNCCYARVQGGSNGIIIDPQPGDIGVAVFADRDISKVKSTGAQANPGSRRQFDMADGIYILPVLSRAPTQFIQFNADGITVTSPTKIILRAPTVEIDASSQVTVNTPTASYSGQITAQGDVTAQGTSLHGHVHTKVKAGGDQSGAPA